MNASYIPTAIRAYIQSEWCGAAASALSAMRGEITAALLAADPELSNTAATFRFHKLVAEMRDNDEISPETLARTTPQADNADAERLAAKVANVMGDWRGKTIVLASGRWATVGEYDAEHRTVRLISNAGTVAADAAWYPAETIWRGLEFGTILTPDQIVAGEASIAEQA